MYELPLYPLQTVLFPGMPLALRVTTARHRQLIQACVEKDHTFGVVFVGHGTQALPIAGPHYVGCTAKIFKTRSAGNGKPVESAGQEANGALEILVLGGSRFRILDLDQRRPYLRGRVAAYPLDESAPYALVQSAISLRPLLQRYMHILNSASPNLLDPRYLPSEPAVLAYLAAVLLQVPPIEKQALLATERAVDLLHAMHRLYRREIALLEAILARGDPIPAPAFSPN
jgi:Lon protease-like protein